MKTRNVFALGALLLVPAFTAGAQFTAVVAPPPAQKQAVAEAAAKAEVPRDTGRRATLQAMSAWVDSVAGVPAPSAIVSDSVASDVVVGTDSTPAPVEQAPATTRFADGVRAPDTASPLPFLLVAGLGALLFGGWLLVTGRREAPVPAVRPPRAS